MDGKTALVTGAAGGIGRAIAEALLTRGCRVAAIDVREEPLAAFRSDAEARGWKLLTRAADVAEEKSVTDAVEHVLSEFGGLSFLVNNAGIVRDRLLVRMGSAEWNAVLRVNLDSVFFTTRAVVRSMMKAQHGRIVSISSVVALMGNPGQTNYAASKAGIIGFSRALALEVASRGITVNVVAPGFIDTDMTRALKDDARAKLIERIPAGRLGTCEDVVGAVLFLMGDGASYMTGQVIEVNGGMHLG